MGKIGNKESLAFLASKVSLRIPMREMMGVEDMLLTPCVVSLQKQSDWRAAQAVIESLDDPRSERELILLSIPLRNVLHRDVALAVVENQLLQKPAEARKKNLLVLKKFLAPK